MKYFFISTVLAGTLVLPSGSFASPMPVGPVDNGDSSFYAKLQYNGELFNRIGKFSPTSKNFPKALGLSKNSSADDGNGAGNFANYDPSYKPSYFGGSAALGLSFGDAIGVEIEGLYSRVQLESKEFTSEEAAKSLILPGKGVSEGTISINNSVYLVNDGFTNIAAMVNFYYKITSDDIPVAPYVGVGAGMTKISFLDSYRFAFAYQAKGGVMCNLNENASLFTGYRYFGVFDDTLTAAPVNSGNTEGASGDTSSKIGDVAKSLVSQKNTIPTSIGAKNSFAVHGIEAGIIFKF